MSLVFETHATTVDNEAGRAAGWLPGSLSTAGRAQAIELGRRRSDVDVVLCSDLARAAATVSLAFRGTDVPVLLDWRLRECDYGEWNGASVARVHHGRLAFLDAAYPGGESWRQAVDRVASVLPDIARRWRGRQVLVVGHLATRFALDEALAGVPLADSLAAEFGWQPGWLYDLPA